MIIIENEIGASKRFFIAQEFGEESLVNFYITPFAALVIKSRLSYTSVAPILVLITSRASPSSSSIFVKSDPFTQLNPVEIPP